MKRLVAALCFFSVSSALAQVDAGIARPPAAKAAPAPAAVAKPGPTPSKGLGSAKEDDDEPPPTKKPLVIGVALGKPGMPDGDAGLLRALLYAFEPAPTEIRVIAIEDLGILGDPRALNPLAQIVMDPNPAVQAAALRAIASIQHPRAEAILSNIVRHPSLNEKVKMSAIEALVFQNTPTSVTFLSFLTTANQFHPVLQQQARRVLQEVPQHGRAL